MDISFVGTSGGELEHIQFLLGHASVQMTECYPGCKESLGHPANDLLDLAKDGRAHQMNFPSAELQEHTTIELASRQELECGHRGSEHDQPF
jgi:hypothetical protein